MSEEVQIDDPKAVLDALERAKKDAKKARERVEALEGELAAAQAESEQLRTEVQTLTEGDSQWKDRHKSLLIKSALDGDNAERVMKFLDVESIGLDDEGNLTGLDDAVNKVKADLPELFNTKRRVGGAADLFEKGEPAKKPTGTEAQVARIFSKS